MSELLDKRENDGPATEAAVSPLGITGSDGEVPSEGLLRIFLGAAPGVGKTYAMLVEAHMQKAKGVDVVIGFVETYERAHTIERIGNLEIVPRKRVPYRGVVLEEMDTEAVLARHPQIVLVDELAHTNGPGSPHEKRYEDVLDLLHAGISVWTTLNVQHLESVHTKVEIITGVAVRETVPDWVVDRADEISLVDVSVDEMHRRMSEGNIYPPAQAHMAMQNFYRKGNLTALRELALRRTAENVDAALETYMAQHAIQDSWAAADRIMVAIDTNSFSKDLIRRGWSLARGLKAPLLVVHVHDPSRHYTQEQEASLKSNLDLAEDLGAEIAIIENEDVADGLAKLAHEKHITQIVIGKSQEHGLKSLFSPSLPRRLADMVTQDIHLVTNHTG